MVLVSERCRSPLPGLERPFGGLERSAGGLERPTEDDAERLGGL